MEEANKPLSTPNKTVPTQKFNMDWLKDENLPFVKRSTCKGPNKEELKDEQGRPKYDEYKFYCDYCNKDIKCEKFKRHITAVIGHVIATPDIEFKFYEKLD